MVLNPIPVEKVIFTLKFPELQLVVAGEARSPDNGAYSALLSLSAGDGVKNVVVTQADSVNNIGSDNRDLPWTKEIRTMLAFLELMRILQSWF